MTPDLTGTGQSSAELLGVPGGVLAETLAGHLVREIMVRGSRGGPLAPLADQLNHDVTHLQGQRLEGMLAQLAGQVTALARAGSVPRGAEKAGAAAPRPAFLAGREELLAELDARLPAGDESGPRMVALCGLGGAGKTSVAVEYAHRHLAEVGVAWQFAAEDPTVLAAGFGELAAQLGARDLADTRDPVASVHAVLAAVPGDVAAGVRQRAGPGIGGAVPAPGRARAGADHQPEPALAAGQALEVPVLDTEVAADFLVTRTGDPDQQAAAGLAGELGGLPLALEQAAAYIQATGGSLAGYLALFRQRRADLLARGEPAGYGRTVATTWALAFDRLEQSAPGAVGLLRLLAFCAPEAIPLRLLLQPRPGLAGKFGPEVAPVLVPLLEDPLAAGDAVAALRRYSLVSPAADGAVSVHRLVQAVTADQMPAELADAWRQAAAAVIEAAIPEDTAAAGIPGRCTRRCCRTPRRPWPLTATAWRGSPATWDSSGSYLAAREFSSGDRSTHASGCSAPSTPAPWPPAADLACWTGAGGGCGRGPRPVRRAAARHASGCSAPSTRAPWPPAPTSPAGPGRRGMRPGPGTSSPRCCRSRERVSGSEHPDTLAARAQPRLLDRGGGGCGRGPGPVRRAAADLRAGARRRAPATPWPPAATSPTGPGRRGMRPGPGTSSPRCCPSASGCSAPSTQTP